MGYHSEIYKIAEKKDTVCKSLVEINTHRLSKRKSSEYQLISLWCKYRAAHQLTSIQIFIVILIRLNCQLKKLRIT